MGIFYSILHHLSGWVTYTQRRPVDKVLEWLRENDLIEYSSNFVEHGWDQLGVIAEMTEKDIEMCIQKPGHKVKLKRAIAVLKGNQSIIQKHVMDKNSDQNSMRTGSTECPNASTEETSNQDSRRIATTERQNASISYNSHQDSKRTATKESILSSSQTYSNQSEDTQSSIHPLYVSQSCSPGDSKSSTTQSQFDTDIKHAVESVDVINMDIPNKPEGPISIPVANQNYDIEDHDHGQIVPYVDDQNSDIDKETTCDRETSISDGTDNSETETDTHRALEDTNRLGFGDAAMISEEMDEPQNIVALSRNTHALPLSAATAEGTTVNLTIIKHSEHTSITDHATNKIEPERNVNNSNCLHDQMEAVASVDEEKDALYVETRAYEELKTITEDSYWATILGKPGDGKSATAAHLLLYYQRTKGFQPIYLTSVRQWELLISGNKSSKQFVVIDDMFGSTALDGTRTEEWLTEIEKMEKLVQKRQGTLMVVCTSRRHIFTDAKPKLYKFMCFRKASIVDMTDTDSKLSSSEKLDIFKRYATKFEVEFNEEIFRQIEAIDSPHGFPHCVEMFCTNTFLRENGITFFENPEEFVQKELHNFKDNDPIKFLVLLLVLYKKNRLHPRNLGEIVDNSDDEAEKLFKFTGVSLSTSYSSILKAVNALTNTYLTKTGDGYYTFTHESLKENVSSVYISLNSVHATKLLDLQQILTHTNKPNAHEMLPVNDLVERITIEIFSGNIASVSTCASWQDPVFVNEWIRFVTLGFNSLCEGLSKYLTRRTFISDKTPLFWGTRESLIVSLLENKMYDAVIAILKCKNIQKVLGQDEDCLKILESGLEIVCRGGHNIQVVKCIVAFQQATKSRILDGSLALANALAASDHEIAMYLIDHTTIQAPRIRFGYSFTYAKDYILKSLLKSSIDLDNFKQLLSRLMHLQNVKTDELFHEYVNLSKTDICFTRFEYLLDLIEDINAPCSDTELNIVDCVVKNLTAVQCLEALPILKKRGAIFFNINRRSINILHTICIKHNVSQYFDVLKYLVDVGVNPSQQTDDGVVPLMFALNNDLGEECLRWLLSISPQRHTNKNGQGYFHYLLQAMCSIGCLKNNCNILLEANENINLPDAKGATPIMYFLQKSLFHTRSIQDLASFLNFLYSTVLDFHLTDKNGRNVLHYTFEAKQCMNTTTPDEDYKLSTVFDFLVNTVKVDCFLADKNGVNPLMIALKYHSETKTVRKFLKHKIPDQVDKDGNTYNHYLEISREELERKVIGHVLDLDFIRYTDLDLIDLIASSYVNDHYYDDSYGYPESEDDSDLETITQKDIDKHFADLQEALKNNMASSQCNVNP